MPHSQKTKTQNRNNIVTNSMKTLKMIHIKKKNLKKKYELKEKSWEFQDVKHPRKGSETQRGRRGETSENSWVTTLPLTRFPQVCRDFQFPLEFNTTPFRKSSSQEILRFKEVMYCHVGGTDPGQEMNIQGVTRFRLENQHPGRCLCLPSVRRFWSTAFPASIHLHPFPLTGMLFPQLFTERPSWPDHSIFLHFHSSFRGCHSLLSQHKSKSAL